MRSLAGEEFDLGFFQAQRFGEEFGDGFIGFAFFGRLRDADLEHPFVLAAQFVLPAARLGADGKHRRRRDEVPREIIG